VVEDDELPSAVEDDKLRRMTSSVEDDKLRRTTSPVAMEVD
jgi:hypothetical protein